VAGQRACQRIDERQLGVEDLGRLSTVVAAGPEVAQLADGVRVERARHHVRVPECGHALHHLVSSLVRKRDEQDPASGNGFGVYGMRRAAADDTCLARASAGKDDERTVCDLDGGFLGVVQVF
jgi:hypothetical protein